MFTTTPSHSARPKKTSSSSKLAEVLLFHFSRKGFQDPPPFTRNLLDIGSLLDLLCHEKTSDALLAHYTQSRYHNATLLRCNGLPLLLYTHTPNSDNLSQRS